MAEPIATQARASVSAPNAGSRPPIAMAASIQTATSAFANRNPARASSQAATAASTASRRVSPSRAAGRTAHIRCTTKPIPQARNPAWMSSRVAVVDAGDAIGGMRTAGIVAAGLESDFHATPGSA